MSMSEATRTMSGTEESDQLSPFHAQLPTGTSPMTSPSRDSPSPAVANTLAAGSILNQRSTRRSAPTAAVVSESDPTTSTHQPSIFNTPSRSISATGPPTSSLSVNTAQASMSAPSPANTVRSFSALAAPSSSAPQIAAHHQTNGPILVRRSRFSHAENDVDNPSSQAEQSTSAERRTISTPVALNSLFPSAETSKPTIFGQASVTQGASATTYTSASTDFAPLPSHLYTRGLINGIHSDLTVHAFGASYALHKLLLDRAPFFSCALAKPWLASSTKAITLCPEVTDPNITQAAFELALKRIYGCNIESEEDKEAIGLFATGSWLQMSDLIESSVSCILRQMLPAKLSFLIRLVTSNYYGISGERILSSAKAMLCREGWEMPLKYWDGIKGEIIREIIGGDGFFVPGEWERWVLVKRVLDRRLKIHAIKLGLMDKNGKCTQPPPVTIDFLASRLDTAPRKQSASSDRPTRESWDSWLALYNSSDVTPLLVLVDEGIHYIHLTFEQLQKIRDQRDVMGLTITPQKVISNALWMSMELRQKVVNAKESDRELGLSFSFEKLCGVTNEGADAVKASSVEIGAPSLDKGKQVESNDDHEEKEDMHSGSWDGNGEPRKFLIPSSDSTSIIVGNSDVIDASPPWMTRHLSRFPNSLDPQNFQWVSDFTTIVKEKAQTHNSGSSEQSERLQSISYSNYPPFRFAGEFPSLKNLKDKKRFYSRTIWYAGSLWRMYIQKVETAESTELGVYLYRAKEEESGDSFDERISQVRLLMQRNQTGQRHQGVETRAGAGNQASGAASQSGGGISSQAVAFNNLPRGEGILKAIQSSGTQNLSTIFYARPTLPPYVDSRSTIKTYFRIYCPNQPDGMLSVHESAPENFNIGQSWGWKGVTTISDDALRGDEGVGGEAMGSNDNEKLRFMVVIGHV